MPARVSAVHRHRVCFEAQSAPDSSLTLCFLPALNDSNGPASQIPPSRWWGRPNPPVYDEVHFFKYPVKTQYTLMFVIPVVLNQVRPVHPQTRVSGQTLRRVFSRTHF